MKYKQFMIAGLGALLVLSGCGGGNEDAKTTDAKGIEAGDYDIQLPFESSDSRVNHRKTSGSMNDVYEIGAGLMSRSKDHFSPDSYMVQEGQVLTYSKTKNLLGSQSEDNSNGLNPKKDEDFDTGNGILKNPFIVTDIYELDFMKNKEIKGLSIALVLQDTFSEDAKTEAGVPYQKKTKMDSKKLRLYGEEAGRKLISYLRKQPQVGDDMPIYIALFLSNSSDETLPGSYFADAYFTSRSKEFSDIDEEWVMFPSSRAEELDSATLAQFKNISKSIEDFLPEDVGFVGQGRFNDKKLNELRITVNLQAKDHVECVAVIQRLNSLLNDLSNQDMVLKVDVRSNRETIAVLNRKEGTSKITVTMLI